MGAVLPRRRRVLSEAREALGDALVVDVDRGALRQLADGPRGPVEPRVDHRFEDAALARADGLGERPLLQLMQRHRRAGDGFQCCFALQGGEAGLGMMQKVAHARRKLGVELAGEHLIDADGVFVNWPRLGRGLGRRQTRDTDGSHSMVSFQTKENRRGWPRRLVVSKIVGGSRPPSAPAGHLPRDGLSYSHISFMLMFLAPLGERLGEGVARLERVRLFSIRQPPSPNLSPHCCAYESATMGGEEHERDV